VTFVTAAFVATAGLAACSGGSGGSHPSSTTTPATTTTAPGPGTTPPTAPPGTVPPSSKVVTVPARIDPSGRRDVTKALQAFLASVPNRRVIRFRLRGRYRINGTLFVQGRHELTIDGNHATFFAKTRGAPDRAQWWIKDGSRIVFRDLTVLGANPSGGTSENAYVRKLETQHGFRFEGVQGAELDHVAVHDVYGDFVYVGRDHHKVPSADVWIHDSVFSRNGRQGIAVTAATNVVIERNHLDHTRRSTIDLEPNSRSWVVKNVFVLDNTVGKGRLLFVASHGQGPVNDVVISGNRLTGHPLTIDAMAPDGTRRSNWVVSDNVSDAPVHTRPMRFFGIDGLVVRGNTQPVTGREPGVVLTDVCGDKVSGNDFGSGIVRRTTASCSAALTVPKPSAIPGRGAGGSSSTSSLPSTTRARTPTSIALGPPASVSTSTSIPSSSARGSGGFDLFDGVLVALAASVLLAIALAWRSRRPRAN
jgi:hypothetical protein